MIPDNFALGRDECLQRCGLSRGPQPSMQRQPRVAGNALPSSSASSSSSSSSSSAWASATSSSAATPSPASMQRRALVDASASEERMVAYYRPAPVLSAPAVTAAAVSSLMLGLVGAMGAGYVVLAVLYLRDRAQRRTVELAESLPIVARYSDKPSVTAV